MSMELIWSFRGLEVFFARVDFLYPHPLPPYFFKYLRLRYYGERAAEVDSTGL